VDTTATVAADTCSWGRFQSFPVAENAHFYVVCRYVERNPVRELTMWHCLIGSWAGSPNQLDQNHSHTAHPKHFGSMQVGCRIMGMVSLDVAPVASGMPLMMDWPNR